MEPFYFGEQGRKLLGLYHPPMGLAANHGVLICPPILGEYMRTQGCLRHLAVELAERGNHVLRFDYSGTGDSGGSIQEASIAAWLDDIHAAGKELQEISGVSGITVVGVRLGAALALEAADNDPLFQRLILWDPLEDGNTYLQGLGKTYEALIASHEGLDAAGIAEARTVKTGYALTDPLLEGIRALRIKDSHFADSERLSIFLTDKAVFDSGRWQGRAAGCHFVDYNCNWATFSEALIFGRSLVHDLAQQV